MLEDNLLREAERQLEICNACRYCEGYCAVFPAIERRRSFSEADVLYLANLCHDCRDCYTACMYAPPHEFNVNIPALMSNVRLQVYHGYASPRRLGSAFRAQRRAVALTVLASLLVVLGLAIMVGGPSRVVAPHTGAGAFYAVIPFLAMLVPATAISVYIVLILVRGVLAYWRDIAGPDRSTALTAMKRATADSLSLTYLRGGGAGCNYPRDYGSYSRRTLHVLVFYGFASALLSTTLAAVYQDFLGQMPPYPVLSLPVLFGAVGGAGMIVGTTGLIYLKTRSDRRPSNQAMIRSDYAFMVLLDLVATTGILLLLLRDTRVMGVILAIHLGFVLGFFVTAPYGKFVHWVYRYAALIKNASEMTPRR